MKIDRNACAAKTLNVLIIYGMKPVLELVSGEGDVNGVHPRILQRFSFYIYIYTHVFVCMYTNYIFFKLQWNKE